MQLSQNDLYALIWRRVGPVPIKGGDPASIIAAAEAASQAITAALDGFTSHPDADALRREVWEEVLDALLGYRGGTTRPSKTDRAVMSKRPY